VHYLDRKNDARKKNGVKDRQCPSHEVDVPPHEVWPCSPVAELELELGRGRRTAARDV